MLGLQLFSSFGALGAIGGEPLQGNELIARKVGNTLVLDINMPLGVYDVEYSNDLKNWLSYTTESSDGFSFQLSDVIVNRPKFFRLNRISLGNPTYASGYFISNLYTRVSIEDLRRVFSWPATVVKPTSLDLAGLQNKTYSERLFLASILALSKISEDIRASVSSPYAGLDQHIVDAIVADLRDGKFNGKDSNVAIQIGTTGVTLASKVSNGVVVSAFEHIRKHTAGIRNIQLATTAQPGVFTLSCPAFWSYFYWDGATWQ